LFLDKVSLLADFSVQDGEGDEAYQGDAEGEEGEVALGFSLPKLSGIECAFFFLLGFEEGGFLLVFVLAFELGLFADGLFVADGVFVGGVEAVVEVSGFPEVVLA
jgi:hypothetical protein